MSAFQPHLISFNKIHLCLIIQFQGLKIIRQLFGQQKLLRLRGTENHSSQKSIHLLLILQFFDLLVRIQLSVLVIKKQNFGYYHHINFITIYLAINNQSTYVFGLSINQEGNSVLWLLFILTIQFEIECSIKSVLMLICIVLDVFFQNSSSNSIKITII
ncbi:unnamed protein product [Paramecium octaurelia]|uniref:Uncharacterized protein n=1 Tax=Paramecium octaurelia TaxID=43137 RepID=A0A8S1YNS7_PAROT|nr:unnamed protein product [Paramecium octaurelia]